MNEWDLAPEKLAHINLDEYTEKRLINSFKSIIYDFSFLSVLDYGCGGGYFAEWVTSNYNCHYYGYDISFRSLERAKKRNPYLEFTDKLNNIPGVDVLVCLSVIQHMTKDQLKNFIKFCEESKPKEILLQYRYGDEYNEDNLVYRMRNKEINIKGYKTIWKSEVIKGNDYVYECKGLL